MSANPVVEKFTAALLAFEADGRPDALVELFADDAELSNLARAERGWDGARRFWEEYRRAFAAVRSAFTAVTVGDRGGRRWSGRRRERCRAAARSATAG